MNKEVLIWDRKINIRIDYDLYDNETATDEQEQRLEEFINNTQLLNDKTAISEYCLKNNGKEIGDNVDNLFKYVAPTAILIPQSKKNKRIILLCNYKFDIEHGIAIIFENNSFSKIVPQDDVL